MYEGIKKWSRIFSSFLDSCLMIHIHTLIKFSACKFENLYFFNYVLKSPINQYRKDEILIIGDNLHSDIIGGNKAGIDTCWVSHGRENNTDIVPNHSINNFLEIESVLN